MRLTYFHFPAHLKSQLLPIYLIIGNEPMLIQEVKNAIQQKANELGFLDIRHYEVNKEFEWDELLASINTPSLLSERSYIELKIRQKPNSQSAKMLTLIVEKYLNPDTLLVLLVEKLDSSSQKSPWVQAINKLGAIISIWPLDEVQFKQWLKKQLHHHQLSFDQFVVEYLAEQTEGNLLAAAQEIEKLKLLYPSGQLPLEELKSLITDNARYDIFNFIDICLQGNLTKIIKVLHKLRSEGTEPTLILWAFTREIRKLINILCDINSHLSWEVITKKHQIWDKRQPLFKKIRKQHSIENLQNLLLHSEKIDKTIKGLIAGNVWDEIELLAIQFSGAKAFSLRM